MRHFIHIVWLVPFLGAAALGADELPQPKKDPTAPPPSFPDVPAVRAPVPSPDANSAELQRLLRDLRTQREALRNERSANEQGAPGAGAAITGNEEEIARLRKRMQELATRSADRSPGGPGHPPESSPLTLPPPSAAAGGVLDPVGLAQDYFRAGDYQSALDAYRKVPLRGASGEERAPVMYMIATCLRKMGKRDEAAKVYTEVATIKDDPFVADCARWQLETLNWKKDLETQLAQLRQRRKGLEPKP